MNKQTTPLDQLVQSLTSSLTKSLVPKKAKKKQRRRKSTKSLSLSVPRNQGLNLTSSQFTATSPLNLFQVSSGSTPGGIRVKGRELIGRAVNGTSVTGGFQLLSGFGAGTTLGAGNPYSFPRLSSYSNIYEYFTFHKVTYIFQSNQPTTAPGEVLLAIDYDPTDAAPASAADMMRNVSSTMSNIYSDNSLQVLKSLSRLPRYETATTPTEVLQQLQYQLYVAIEGITATSGNTLGYIIADYDVEFFTPQ